jgi:hypothetical protein
MNPKRKRWDVETFLKHFDDYDARLVAAGFHATPPKWRQDLETFLRSGCRRWVVRAGRRAGKSSFWCRLAVVWALHGPWSIPGGDIATIPFISIDRDEASARIRTIKEILKVLGIAHDPRTDDIEIGEGNRRAIFKVETCSISSVGFTAVMIVLDEMARWESRDDHSNPAKQVAASVRPSMATQVYAIEICSSSAWSEADYHYDLVETGTNTHQFVTMGPTWEYNPTISEEFTHELESDETTRLREYGNVPGGTVSQALNREDIAAAHGRSPLGKAGRPFLAIDASKLKHDSFAWCSGVCSDAGVDVLQVGSFEGKDFSQFKTAGKLPTEHVIEQIAGKARALGVQTVFGDDYEDSGLRPLFRQQSIDLVTWHWSLPSKERAFSLLRRLLKDGRFTMVKHQKLFDQMSQCRAHLLPGGATSYATNGLDHLSCVIALCHALNDGRIELAPPPKPGYTTIRNCVQTYKSGADYQ